MSSPPTPRGPSRARPLLLVASLAACSDRPEPAPEQGTTDGLQDEAQLMEALHRIGYVDLTDEEASEERSGAARIDLERAAAGYRFYIDPGSCEARLVNLHGEQVHRWRQLRCESWSYGELLPDGDLLVTSDSSLRRERWNDWPRWSIRDDVHHAPDHLPDGRILALTEERRQLPAETMARFVNNFDEVRHRIDELWLQDHCLVLLDTRGEELERRCLLAMLDDNDVGFELQRNKATFDRESDQYLVDLFHLNSARWLDGGPLAEESPLYQRGNVLISVRNQDSVMIFDWEKAALRWAWGQGELAGQHDASLLEDGRILLFDNGVDWTELELEIEATRELPGIPARHAGRSRVHPSRVLEVDPRTGLIPWEFPRGNSREINSLARGSAQRLPNGNTLIAVSGSGAIVEVTRDGDIVWEYFNPMSRQSRRATIVNARHYDGDWVEALLARE
jgi:hypothetical protein